MNKKHDGQFYLGAHAHQTEHQLTPSLCTTKTLTLMRIGLNFWGLPTYSYVDWVEFRVDRVPKNSTMVEFMTVFYCSVPSKILSEIIGV